MCTHMTGNSSIPIANLPRLTQQVQETPQVPHTRDDTHKDSRMCANFAHPGVQWGV